MYSVADLGGAPGARPLPLPNTTPPPPHPQTKIFSISCSYSENLIKLYVGAPHCRVGAPSYGKSWIRPWYCYFVDIFGLPISPHIKYSVATQIRNYCGFKAMAQPEKGGGCQHIIWPIFPENEFRGPKFIVFF